MSQIKSSNDPSKSAKSIWALISCEYYICVLCLLSTYAWLRHAYWDAHIQWNAVTVASMFKVDAPTRASFQTWEWQFAVAIFSTAAWRMHTASSSMASSGFTLLGFAQGFVIVMSFLVNEALSIQYAAAFLLLFLLLEQPNPSGKGTVEILTPIMFKARVKATEPTGVTTLIFLHTKWSLSCRHAHSTFKELSDRFSTDRVVFAQMDLSEFPHMAPKLNVDITPGSWQLPTVVMFEGGEEQMRVPRRKGKELSKDVIIKAFELDMRLATSMKCPGKSGNGSGKESN